MILLFAKEAVRPAGGCLGHIGIVIGAMACILLITGAMTAALSRGITKQRNKSI